MPHARVTAERPGLYTRARRPSAMSLRWNKLNQNVNRFAVEPCLARSGKQGSKWPRNQRGGKRPIEI